MSPLSQRVLTATLLIVLLAVAFWRLDETGITVLFFGFVAIAAWEWCGLAGLAAPAARLLYAAATVGLGALLFTQAGLTVMLAIVGAGAAWWLYALLRLFAMQRHGIPPRGGVAARLATGWLVMVPALLSILLIYGRGLPWLAAMFLIIWVADSAAYFGGRRYGRSKLASRISPGKTREGVYAGLAAVLVLALAFVLLTGRDPLTAVLSVALALLVALASVVGDLYESICKRQAGCKDSGRILPGHGGMLDRIDGVLAAAPVFLLGIQALGSGGAG